MRLANGKLLAEPVQLEPANDRANQAYVPTSPAAGMQPADGKLLAEPKWPPEPKWPGLGPDQEPAGTNTIQMLSY